MKYKIMHQQDVIIILCIDTNQSQITHYTVTITIHTLFLYILPA